MKVLVTGSSQGIGKAITELFLRKGHDVTGIDRQASSIDDARYTHIKCDVRDILPDMEDVEILINNAGTQNEEDIDINLKALISFVDSICGPEQRSLNKTFPSLSFVK